MKWWRKREESPPRNKDDTVVAGKSYRVVVTRIAEGKHGPFFFAASDVLGSVTCSLLPDVWHGEEEPVVGEEVIVWKLKKKPAGWWARHGRDIRPPDEITDNRQQTKE